MPISRITTIGWSINDMSILKHAIEQGLELARKILAVRPNIPVILYTGYSASVNGREAKRIGIREFMMKPLSMTHLALTIRRVLNSA